MNSQLSIPEIIQSINVLPTFPLFCLKKHNFQIRKLGVRKAQGIELVQHPSDASPALLGSPCPFPLALQIFRLFLQDCLLYHIQILYINTWPRNSQSREFHVTLM